MQIKLFKVLTAGFLAFSAVSLAHAGEYATVTIQNHLGVSYNLVDYYHVNTGFFGGYPVEIGPDVDSSPFTGEFHENGDRAGFTIKPSNNPNCIDDPRHRLGLCYDAEFSYSSSTPFPQVQLFAVSGSHSQPCKSCRLEFDIHNRDDVTVIINTSLDRMD